MAFAMPVAPVHGTSSGSFGEPGQIGRPPADHAAQVGEFREDRRDPFFPRCAGPPTTAFSRRRLP
jgi:hypothetical protein